MKRKVLRQATKGIRNFCSCLKAELNGVLDDKEVLVLQGFLLNVFQMRIRSFFIHLLHCIDVLLAHVSVNHFPRSGRNRFLTLKSNLI